MIYLKHGDDVKEKAYMLYATNGNVRETARELGLPTSTVHEWIKNKRPDGLDQLREEKKRGFVEKSSDIIDKGLSLIEKMIDDEINARTAGTSDGKVTITQVSTAIGTLYDKRALAKGESTQNTTVNIKIPEDAKEYAE